MVFLLKPTNANFGIGSKQSLTFSILVATFCNIGVRVYAKPIAKNGLSNNGKPSYSKVLPQEMPDMPSAAIPEPSSPPTTA